MSSTTSRENTDTALIHPISEEDIDASIAILQANINHKQRVGEIRYSSGQIMAYRPGRTTRKEIKQLRSRLEGLYEYKRKMKTTARAPRVTCRKSAAVHTRNVTIRQIGGYDESEDDITTTYARILYLADRTDISLRKWIEETDKDPELNLLRQALLDRKTHQIPAAYTLFEDELRVLRGLIFVGDKLLIPKSMREWVIQVAHGDHVSATKMAEITENVYWPNKTRDLEKKAQDCVTCFRAGKNLHPRLPTTHKNPLPRPKTPNELIQIDFLGPITNEKGKKKYVIVAIDNCSKYTWSKVVTHCSTKSVIKFLKAYFEDNGLPAEIKTDNGAAFKSNEFANFLADLSIKLTFCTPYVHNAIGTVERTLRTLQDYMKVYLIEENNLKKAVRRATTTLRKTISKSTGKTPFEIHFGRKPRSVLTNVIDLERRKRRG